MANALNPGIILSGQQPDIVGIVNNANVAGQRQREFQNQNALNRFISQKGGAVMGGDQQAMNALAGYGLEGLNAAQAVQGNRLSMDQQRLGMQATQQKMDMLSAEEKRAIQAHAMNIGAAQRDAEVAEARQGIMQATQAYSMGDLDGVNQILAMAGEQPIQSLDQFPSIAVRYEGALEAMEAVRDFNAPQGQDGDRFKVVGSQLVDLQAEGGPQTVITAQGQEEVVYGPDGQPILTRGPAGSTVKFTEGQSKDNVYSTRARGALEALEPVANSLTGRMERAAEFDPTGIARGFQSGDFQVAKQAGDEFLQAILRKDTGAAITQQEQDAYGRTYLPQPGDGPEVLAQKRQARIRAINAIESGMTSSQMLAQERALANTEREMGATGRIAVTQPTQVTPQMLQTAPEADVMMMIEQAGGFSNLSDEQLQAIEARGQ